MDKFNRKPSRAKRLRRLAFAAGAFAIPAAAFALLFLYGSRLNFIVGLKGLGAVYLAAALVSVVVVIRQALVLYRQWLDKLGFQPIQGPGFTPLELAALGELTTETHGAATMLRRFLSDAEVVSRFNNGAGCITQIRSALLLPHAPNALVCFHVGGLPGPIGCRLWPAADGAIALVEFFTDGVDTRRFDWATADFEIVPVPPGLRPPQMRPISIRPAPSYDKVLAQGASR